MATTTVSKDGLYFPSGTNNIKWSQLRDTFKRNAPSEPQQNGSLGTIISGTISASDLLRNTSRTETNPYVPDCTENADVGSSTNWKVSQMRDTIKYMWVTVTGNADGYDLDATPSWNSNIDKTIVKRLYVDGDFGTPSYSDYASRLSVRVCNLTVDVRSGGSIHGGGGDGGTATSSPPNDGKNGGTALWIQDHPHQNMRVWMRSGGEIWGGGGGGGRGSTGAQGCNGTCWDYQYTTVASGCNYCGDCGSGWERYGGCADGGLCNCYSSWGWTSCSGRYKSTAQCRKKNYTTINGGNGGGGGNGAHGRGDDYSGSLNGLGGAAGTPWAGCGSYDGTGTTGCQGQTGLSGGAGGDWAQPGSQGTQNGGIGGQPGRAIGGDNYSVHGTINSSTLKGNYNP